MQRPHFLRAGIMLLALILTVVIGQQVRASFGTQMAYMPLIQNESRAPTSTPVTTTPVPGSPTPTSTPTSGPVAGALYITTSVETASASAQVDAAGGMHSAFVHFTSAPDASPAVYMLCTAAGTGCDNPANWSGVMLADDARDVQLQLTPDGKPRLLIVTYSTVYSGGKDYLYAECNSACTTPGGWTITLVASSDGTSIFDVNDQAAPQRSFAIDPQGRPAFVYQDRNYLIEPDHIGFYYMRCESGCANVSNWVSTNIGRTFPYDYETFAYASLDFTSTGNPRLFARVFALNDDGSDAPEGLYYYACDTGCDTMTNWDRTLLFYPGSGSYPLPAWDMEIDSDNNPHVVFFTGGGADSGIDYQLVYITCPGNCLGDNSWSGTVLGLPLYDGQGPDIELNAANDPRVAFVYENGDLGYAWCNNGCEASHTAWQAVVVEATDEQEADNPQALPPNCDQDLWQGLTPTLALDTAGNPRIAHDIMVDARCTYEDPDDPNNPIIRFERVWNGVRWNFFPQP